MWAVTAALVAGGGAAAGCKAQTTGSAPIHVTKTSVAPAPDEKPARSSVSNSTDDKSAGKPAGAPQQAKRAAPADPVLFTTGAGGAQVRELQARLRKLQLFDRNPTGYYGSVTKASVRAFQRQQGMSAGGAVTSSVWAALRARTAPPSHDELYPPTTLPLDDPDPLPDVSELDGRDGPVTIGSEGGGGPRYRVVVLPDHDGGSLLIARPPGWP